MTSRTLPDDPRPPAPAQRRAWLDAEDRAALWAITRTVVLVLAYGVAAVGLALFAGALVRLFLWAAGFVA